MNEPSFFLIVAGVAFLAGVVVSSFVVALRKPPAVKEVVRPLKPEPMPAPQTPQYPPDAVHLWRDEQRQEVVLKIGQRIFAADESLSPREQKFIRNLLVYLQRWLDTPVPQAPVVVPTSSIEQPLEPALNISQLDPDDLNPPANLSIVEQVNAILQRKLAVSPLKNMGILLMEIPNKGMVVMIGADQYPDVDSVPDIEIRALIQSAVREWENQV